jgi:hypothetical protein
MINHGSTIAIEHHHHRPYNEFNTTIIHLRIVRQIHPLAHRCPLDDPNNLQQRSPPTTRSIRGRHAGPTSKMAKDSTTDEDADPHATSARSAAMERKYEAGSCRSGF